jgi:AcrR family transcriptional regulator
MAAEAGTREPGLRERNKQRRQDAVVRAAYRLFAERGYDATTVADIAAAAEVAPRTVAMYFPTKQDIALSRFGEAADELTNALRQRDPGESVTQVLARWLRTDDRPADREIKQLSKRLFTANPELSARRRPGRPDRPRGRQPGAEYRRRRGRGHRDRARRHPAGRRARHCDRHRDAVPRRGDRRTLER